VKVEKLLHMLKISIELNVEFGGNNKSFNVRRSPPETQSELCICTWEADKFSASSRSGIRVCAKRSSKKEKPGLLSCITTGIGCAHWHT
jgi:hypothetical protein